ncbi:MAG: CinA family protein [Casimicrobiaceae bacterium]
MNAVSPKTDDALVALAARVGEAARARRAMLATAESCTGWLVAGAITAVAGSSDWFERGFVTYSNRAKVEELGVDPAIIERFGAVSAETARAMAQGARAASGAQWTVAVTGIAGPAGGSPDKPVGTVWFAWAGPDGAEALHRRLDGDRTAVRAASVEIALQGLLDRLT